MKITYYNSPDNTITIELLLMNKTRATIVCGRTTNLLVISDNERMEHFQSVDIEDIVTKIINFCDTQC
jgi:hypothetical protein